MIPVSWSAYEPEVKAALDILGNGTSSWDDAYDAMDFICAVAQEGYTTQVFDQLAPRLLQYSTQIQLSLLGSLMDSHTTIPHSGLEAELIRLLHGDDWDLITTAALALHDVCRVDKNRMMALREGVILNNLRTFDVIYQRLFP